MARSSLGSSHLNTRRPSTGFRALIACVLASVLILTFYMREGEGGPVHLVRAGVSVAMTPVRLVGSVAAAPFGAIGNAVGNLTASEQSLSDLKRENAELTAKVAELSESSAQASRLEGLLGLRSTYSLQSTAARIIGASSDAWTSTVTIDKGTADGLATGMPVCNSGGVIGQIIEVSATSSTVRLITDEQSGVSAMVQSSRAQGMLQGQPDGSLRLAYVPADAEVKNGDIVITSGLGGVFPKGLPLGVVTSVERASNASYYTIVVRAQAAAENNEEVLVITALTADQTATAEDVQAANSDPAGSSQADAAAGGATDSGQAADQGSGTDATTGGE